MTEYSLNLQGQGHLGKCLYDVKKRDWDFSRSLQPDVQLEVSSAPILLSIGQVQARSEPHLISSYYQRNLLEYVYDTYPDLLAASNSHDVDAVASAILSIAKDDYDIAAGSVLACEHLKVDINDTQCTICVAAGGPYGSELQIWILESPVVNTAGVQPHVDKVEERQFLLYEQDQCLPILQLSLAHKEGSENAYKLAMRLQSSIIIATVQIEASPTPTVHSSSINNTRCQHKLLFQRLLEIPVQEEFNQQIDMCFNPWCSRELAVVNKVGKWTLYHYTDFRADRPFVKHDPQPLLQGRIALNYTRDSPTQTTDIARLSLDDGWSRICWIANAAMVAICTRKKLHFLQLKARSTITFECDLPDDLIWYLDMIVAGPKQEDVFVLTSLRLLWIKAQTGASEESNTTSLTQPILTHSARHFRYAGDLNLRLKTLHFRNGYFVLLFSCQSMSISYLYLATKDSRHKQDQSTNWADLTLPSDLLGKTSNELGVLDIALHKLPAGDADHFRQSIRMLLLLSDRSMHALYLGIDDGQFHIDGRHVLSSTRTRAATATIHLKKSGVVTGPATSVAEGSHRVDPFVEDLMQRNEGLADRPVLNMHRVYQNVSRPRSTNLFAHDSRSQHDAFMLSSKLLAPFVASLSLDSLQSTIAELKMMYTQNLPARVQKAQETRMSATIDIIAADLYSAATEAGTGRTATSKSRNSYELPILESMPSRSKQSLSRKALAAPPMANSQQRTLQESQKKSNDNDEDDEEEYLLGISVLNKFCNIRQPVPKHKMSTIRNLNHWRTGEDPSSYNFLASWSADDQFTQLAQMSQDEKKRAQRQQRAIAKQQAKESQRFLASQQQSQGIGSSMPWASMSQPHTQANEGMAGANSQALLRQALASQRERNAATQSSQDMTSTPMMADGSSQMPGFGSQSGNKKKRRKLGF